MRREFKDDVQRHRIQQYDEEDSHPGQRVALVAKRRVPVVIRGASRTRATLVRGRVGGVVVKPRRRARLRPHGVVVVLFHARRPGNARQVHRAVSRILPKPIVRQRHVLPEIRALDAIERASMTRRAIQDDETDVAETIRRVVASRRRAFIRGTRRALRRAGDVRVRIRGTRNALCLSLRARVTPRGTSHARLLIGNTGGIKPSGGT